MFESLLEKWKSLVGNMTKKGIPLPMVRDPKTGEGSITATMMWISFNLSVVVIIFKVSLAIMKLLKIIPSVDESVISVLNGIDSGPALQLFLICSGLYLGRRMGVSKDGKVTEEDQKP